MPGSGSTCFGLRDIMSKILTYAEGVARSHMAKNYC